MIKVSSFRIETDCSNGNVWMDSASMPEMGGFVQGIAFRPQFGIFAMVQDLKNEVHYFMGFPSQEFLDDVYRMPEQFRVLSVYSPATLAVTAASNNRCTESDTTETAVNTDRK